MVSKLILAALVSLSALAQNINTHQGLKPFLSNASARISSGGSSSYQEDCTGAAACWKFDEASGDIVDEIAGVTLTVTGSPTYNVTATDPFDLISPGITTGANKAFIKNSLTTELAIGTADATIEFYYSTTQNSGSPILYEHDDEATNRGYYLSIVAATGVWTFAFTGGSSVNFNYTLPADWNDGNIHKIRLGLNRTTELAELWYDGVSQGTRNIAAITGANIKAGLASFGAYPLAPSVAGFNGTIWFWRLTPLTATNNIGGPGGG